MFLGVFVCTFCGCECMNMLVGVCVYACLCVCMFVDEFVCMCAWNFGLVSVS